jgi:hypothetical protein
MTDDTTNPGPAMAEMVEEVQGVFPSNAALQDAVGKLRMLGFDHADLSLPTTQPLASASTPNQGAAEPLGEDDTRSMRTMGTSMAGTIGALAAAGATVATGGAAGVVIAAAAAVGAGSALAANAVGTAAKHDQEETRDEAAASGQLVLAVHASTKEKQVEAERIMRESGATSVGTVKRSDASTGIDSTGWTG